jgi:hypothetical protein
MDEPTIELLWWEGCPSTERARSELEAALHDVGRPGAEIVLREIRTDGEAEDTGFRGSPTILIGGIDLLKLLGQQSADEEIGLSCRVYRRRDGRISPTPDPADLRAALQRSIPVKAVRG